MVSFFVAEDVSRPLRADLSPENLILELIAFTANNMISILPKVGPPRDRTTADEP